MLLLIFILLLLSQIFVLLIGALFIVEGPLEKSASLRTASATLTHLIFIVVSFPYLWLILASGKALNPSNLLIGAFLNTGIQVVIIHFIFGPFGA